MKLTNMIAKVLNPKTGREEIKAKEVDVPTTPVRRPLLQYFVAADPMEIATPLGLVEIDPGDHVVVSETGQIKTYKTAEAFGRAYVEASAAAPGGSAPLVDVDAQKRLDAVEAQIRNLNNVLTELRAARLSNDAVNRPPTQ